MSHPVISLIALLALAPATTGDRAHPAARTVAAERVEVTQYTFHSRIVIRIPRILPKRHERLDQPIKLVEKKGPKCVPLTPLDRAVITGPDSIDLLIETGERIRARLDDDCPALDFYPDLYMRLNEDGMMCAGRDAIRSRSGGACPIKTLRRIVEKR